MKKALLIKVVTLLLVHIELCCWAQTTDWQFVNGKAYAEKTFLISGKTSDEIYKDISRWLVKYYVSPEEILKAKIHGEYIRGVAYVPNVITFGSLTRADLHYTFEAKITDNMLVFTLKNAVLVYPGGQDADVDQGGNRRVEEFFHNEGRKKAKVESDQILMTLNDFSGSLLKSLGESVCGKQQSP